MTSTDLLRTATDLPDHEVRRLLVAATGRHWTELILGVDLESAEVERFNALVERRRSDEPLQYIEGVAAFGPIEVSVDPRVLIPRPETEQLFEIVCASVADPRVIVDLCTGSGNLALALKATFPTATVYGVDLSKDVLQIGAQLGSPLFPAIFADQDHETVIRGHIQLLAQFHYRISG
mgnify:CR=1 FL=1